MATGGGGLAIGGTVITNTMMVIVLFSPIFYFIKKIGERGDWVEPEKVVTGGNHGEWW